jgi:uncharacterized protein YqjF (DUF2071 family)
MTEPVTPQAPFLARPRILRQRWLNVSFLHWAVDPQSISHLYPPGTEPDTFDARGYVGLVAFQMDFHGTFLETNIRLYSVDRTGRRGVVFLSLDANRLAFVVAARTVVGVPYRWARMAYAQHGSRRFYSSIVCWPKVTAASKLEVEVGDAWACGPLEHFLTARWGAHVERAGRTWYVPNEHPGWALRTAELIGFEGDGLLTSVGLAELSGRAPDHLAFSDGVPARIGLPVRATKPRAAQPVGRNHGAGNPSGGNLGGST